MRCAKRFPKLTLFNSYNNIYSPYVTNLETESQRGQVTCELEATQLVSGKRQIPTRADPAVQDSHSQPPERLPASPPIHPCVHSLNRYLSVSATSSHVPSTPKERREGCKDQVSRNNPSESQPLLCPSPTQKPAVFPMVASSPCLACFIRAAKHPLHG